MTTKKKKPAPKKVTANSPKSNEKGHPAADDTRQAWERGESVDTSRDESEIPEDEDKDDEDEQ